ncbi:MAG: PAS domain-containing protein [bacterium]
MLIIRKTLFYVFGVTAVMCIILISYDGYYALSQIESIETMQIKYYAEHVLFIGLLCVILLCMGMWYFYYSSRNLLKELDTISGLSRYNLAYTSRYLSKLGIIGNKINELYVDLIKINEMQALKISALAGENTVLIDNIKMNMVVINIQGIMVKCSKKILLYLGLDKNTIIEKNINEIIKGLDVDDITKKLEKTKDMVVIKDVFIRNKNDKPCEIVFYPIFNAKDRLTAMMCIIDETGTVEELSKTAEQIPSKEIKKKRSFIGMFSKNKENT